PCPATTCPAGWSTSGGCNIPTAGPEEDPKTRPTILRLPIEGQARLKRTRTAIPNRYHPSLKPDRQRVLGGHVGPLQPIVGLGPSWSYHPDVTSTGSKPKQSDLQIAGWTLASFD